MKTIKQEIEGTKLQGQHQDMENYDHIILSDEEIESITKSALREARKKIHFQIENKKYWDKVNAPVEYPKFNHLQTLSHFLRISRELNPKFELNHHNERIINILAKYFSGDESVSEFGISLRKGIMLVGPVGCGKTSIMKAFAKNTNNPFAFVTARKVAADYTDKKDGGDYVIQKYSALQQAYPQQNFGFDKIGCCFDDIGVEQTQKHFGNERDVIAEVIYSRYDSGLHNKTHFTANMTADDIENTYGSRIRSRLREMCNFIEFDVNTPDFRN